MAGSTWPTLVAGARAKASEVEAKFDWVEQDLVPMAAGTKVDGTYDLGQAAFRWRDIYSSRQFLGPAGSASSPPFTQNGAATNGVYFPSTSQVAVSSVFVIQNGSVGTPSLALLNSPATGFYRIGSNNLGGTVNGSKWLDVQSTGETIMPLQPIFFAQLSTTASNVTGNGTTYTLTASEEVIDANSDYDPSTGKFTAPVSGRYYFHTHLALSHLNTTTSNTMTLYIVRFFINGVARHDFSTYLNTSITSSTVLTTPSFDGQAIYSLTAGDVVYTAAFVNFRGSDNVSVSGATSGSFFEGRLIG